MTRSHGDPAHRRSSSTPQEPFSTLIGRALRRRCPGCGRGAVFSSHFGMNKSCPSCHVVFWKDPGESLGAMYLDYAFAAAAFIAAWLVISFVFHPSDLILIVVVSAVAVLTVLVLYPWSRCLWTVLVYVSGGIERPQMRAIHGGKHPR
ncbi:MAG: DUF983 domain-containing protein [Candidatus Binataceae bacterium]